MRINNNLMAMNTHRQYAINNSSVAKSTERLSSGSKINRAGDDAAGLAISEKMRAQIRGLNMASKNSEDAISLVQTAEGALTETHSILQRMNELAVQSSSDTNDSTVDRKALNEEYQALIKEIDDIAQKTAFNGKKLLDGTFGTQIDVGATSTLQVGLLGATNITVTGFTADDTMTFGTVGSSGDDYSVTLTSDGSTATATNTNGASSITFDFGDGRSIKIDLSDANATDGLSAAVFDFDVDTAPARVQTGANSTDFLEISVTSMKSQDLGVNGSDNLNTSLIDTRANASAAIDTVQNAINDVSTQRAKLGAIQNRLDHKINNLNASAENLQSAESRIRDIDMAQEMTKFTTQNILVQAATAMLAQANSAPQNVLSLLK